MVTKISMIVFFAAVAVGYFTKTNVAVVEAVAAGVAAVALAVEK